MMIEKRTEKHADSAVVKLGPKKQTVNWPAVYQYLLDYCSDTTIHGFKVGLLICCHMASAGWVGLSYLHIFVLRSFCSSDFINNYEYKCLHVYVQVWG